jgi:hypothetical protein
MERLDNGEQKANIPAACFQFSKMIKNLEGTGHAQIGSFSAAC